MGMGGTTLNAAMKYTLAGLLFVIGVGGSMMYNAYVAPKLDSETVWVAKSDLSPDTPLSPSDWMKESMPRQDVPVGAVSNVQELEGLYTSEHLSPKQVITVDEIQSNPFTITPGTRDVPLAESWIASMSPTLRAGDFVTLTFLPSTMGSGTGKPTTLPTLSSLTHVLVLSVHTSNNQEVVTTPPITGPSGVGAPVNGLGVPNEVDVKLTTSETNELAQAIAEGEKLLISGSAQGGQRS